MGRVLLVWTETFLRAARQFVRRHPDLEGELEEVLHQLEDDPRAPRLRLHALQGTLRGKHAVRLTYSHRIILVLRLTRKEIVLLDIGTHDEVYRV